MSQKQDIQYIRVRHLGLTKGSLLIEDLDTEENKKQPYQIPVYIQENGFVDLPLNDKVLLSFNQGTLRSFIEQGFVSGFVVSDDGSAEVWVAPDGDDTNPGTRSAPFASIQYAIDTLVERVGHVVRKIVHLNQGRYEQSFVNYTKNLSVRGARNSAIQGSLTRFDAELDADTVLLGDGVNPVVTITNMTKEALGEWLADGGFSFSEDGGAYTYTGASIAGRELSYGLDVSFIESESSCGASLENLAISSSDPVLIIGATPDGGNSSHSIFGILFNRVRVIDSSVYMKNVRHTEWIGSQVTGADVVLDTPMSNTISLKGGLTNSVGVLTSARLVSNGGLFISGNGCEIRGDVVAYSGLSGACLIIRGDLSNSGSGNLSLTMSSVRGDLDLTGAGDVTWQGGSYYGTLTDPGNKLGGATAGTYLNVTP